MKKYAKKIKTFIKTHYIISGIIALIVLFIGYKVFTNGNGKTETFTVKTGEIVQKVIVNGKTKPISAVNLAFEVNGTVRASNVKVGSRVSIGQTLVSLDQSQLYADLLRAQANLNSEKARLEELKKGTRPEEIAVSETQVANAKVALSDARKNLFDKMTDAVNNKVDQLFSNPHTVYLRLNLPGTGLQLRNEIETGRLEVESIIKNLGSNTTEADISKVSLLVENVAKAVNMESAGGSLTQATLDGYKSDLSSARASLITAKEGFNSAQSALALAETNLSLKKSGNTLEVIAAQAARVSQNEAQVKSVEAQLSKMTLRSPQNGVVTLQDAKVGEIVTPGKTVISVISDNDLEIESNVSEISVGKVSVGNPVLIRFDAFPGETFNGTVTYIEPAETVVDGVVNYKVTVVFSEKYPQMKSGLTSKLDIITGVKKDVLVIPQYALITKDAGTFVSKQTGNSFSEVPYQSDCAVRMEILKSCQVFRREMSWK